MNTSNRIPLTIIGGYLGAGKTTLLNHILRRNPSASLRTGQGRRLAVIVNDFGKINIDVELIESRDGDTINLANGCVCCTIGDNLAVTLNTLIQRDTPPEHIIIEASGVADPAKVAQYGYAPGLRLDGIIVLVDAETIRQKAQDKYVGTTVLHQLQGADVLVLNKVDLVTDKTRQSVRNWLAEQVPQARIIEAAEGNVPLALLLGDEVGRPDKVQKPAWYEEHTLSYDTWSTTTDTPLDGDAFRAVVAQLPAGVIRAKGILNLIEAPEQRTVFQLVGKRWGLKPGEAWGGIIPSSQLVVIGLPGSIDIAQMEQALG